MQRYFFYFIGQNNLLENGSFSHRRSRLPEQEPSPAFSSFGKYSYRLKVDKDGRQVTIRYRLLLKSGIYDKAQYHEFVTFINQVASGYAQKIVLKKNSKPT